jgi:hypothetical protein
MPRAKRDSILAILHARFHMWLDQRVKRRECLRRHRLMMNAARRLR